MSPTSRGGHESKTRDRRTDPARAPSAPVAPDYRTPCACRWRPPPAIRGCPPADCSSQQFDDLTQRLGADLAAQAHPRPTAKGDLDDAVSIRPPRPVAIGGDFRLAPWRRFPPPPSATAAAAIGTVGCCSHRRSRLPSRRRNVCSKARRAPLSPIIFSIPGVVVISGPRIADHNPAGFALWPKLRAICCNSRVTQPSVEYCALSRCPRP
jgi:hypothetical protein